MGSAASVQNESRSSYHRLLKAKLQKATTTPYVDNEASEFYHFCASGKIDRVHEILQHNDPPDIDDLIKRERNGDTALHAAVRNGHVEVVSALLDHGCSRSILDRHGKHAFQDVDAPNMRQLSSRNGESNRFYESGDNNLLSVHLPNERLRTTPETEERSDNSTATIHERNNKNISYVERFDSPKEVYRHALNQQTTAMWLQFYSWIFQKYSNRLRHDHLNAETFDLDKNSDFQDFIKKQCDDQKAEATRNAIRKAKHKQSLEPLIKMYTSEKACCRSLNRQLSNSTTKHDEAPHLCDRFIMEFHIRSSELEKRMFAGITYRGGTIDAEALEPYEKALESKPPGVIAVKAFTSTSEDEMVALDFMDRDAAQGKIHVLFVISVKKESTNIFGIADLSDHPKEKEILVMPGTLFVVVKIEKNCCVKSKNDNEINCTKIYLDYWHIPVSTMTKILHTIKSAENNVM